MTGRPIEHDLTDEQFGHLIAKRVAYTKPVTGAYWLCHCTNCKGDTIKSRSSLLNCSINYSCGCLYGFRSRVAKLSGHSLPIVSQALNNKGLISVKVRTHIKQIAKELKSRKGWK